MKKSSKTWKKKCDDITTHMIKVHKFTQSIVDSQLKANPNTFKNAFEKLE